MEFEGQQCIRVNATQLPLEPKYGATQAVEQMNIFAFLDDNLAILQEQLPFTITDCRLGYQWDEQCRKQVDVIKPDGERVPLITTLNLKIIDVHHRKGLVDLITYDRTVSPAVVYFNGQPSAYHLYSNWYADII